MGTDPMMFLTRVTVPFIFGTIIVLNMLQNSLFAKMAQPLKGVANVIAAAVIGVALASCTALSRRLASRPAADRGRRDTNTRSGSSNALLSVTFPFLIFLRRLLRLLAARQAR